MTIPSYDNRRSYAGNGSTSVFAFPPPFTANTDLVVQIQAADGTITTKVLGADYSVTGAGNPAGGSVTMIAAPAGGTTLIIYRDVPVTQSVDLQDGGPLPASTINRALDRITMWGQRLKEQISAIGGLASQTVAGLMSPADKTKLDGIQTGAQVNAVTSVAGKTGAVTLVKGDVGLGNVDNTSDLSKPISTATQTALDAKAAKAANLSDLANVDAALANLGGGATGISVFKAANSSTALTAIGATATGSALITAANAGAARSTLGLVIGADVQAFSQRLADIAGITPSQGDILYFNGTAWVRLAAGTSGWFLRTNGTGADPSWVNIPGGGDMLRANNLSDLTNAATARTNLGATAIGDSLFTAATQAAARAAIGAGTGSGSGTVTSVGMTVPAFLSVSGSPITGSGSFAVTLSGTALPAANGGTGQTSYAVGDLLYASGAAALSRLADVATGNVLISGGVGVAPSWGKVGLTTHISGTLAVANGGTNITTYATGDILYASAANTLSKLAAGTDGQVLTLAGGVPSWAATSGSIDYQVFTASGTWTKPAGLTGNEVVRVMIWGGGGGGRYGGGGGGVCVDIMLRASDFGSTAAVTIGSAGVGGTSGTAGGNSSIALATQTITAFGGGWGGASGAVGAGGGGTLGSSSGGTGGPPSGGTSTGPGGSSAFGGGGGGAGNASTANSAGGQSHYGGGGGGSHSSASIGGAGGGSFFGGGGGGGGGNTGGGAGGASIYGGAGGAGNTTGSATTGSAPGGGGGGLNSGAGADGARGECRVWVIKS